LLVAIESDSKVKSLVDPVTMAALKLFPSEVPFWLMEFPVPFAPLNLSTPTTV
jgi:hypothetical protein